MGDLCGMWGKKQLDLPGPPHGWVTVSPCPQRASKVYYSEKLKQKTCCLEDTRDS